MPTKKESLLKEGVDPVSGNEKPVGALPEEVRDDVPAMLSEGEFVLPADVVRYIGLNNIMKLRDAAKQGLAKMDAQGQMGNSEEAITDDTSPDVNIDSMVDSLAKDAASQEMDSLQLAQGGIIPSSQYTPIMGTPRIPQANIFTTPKTNSGAIQSSQYTPIMNYSPTNTAPSPVMAAPTGAPSALAPYTPPSPLDYLPANAPGAVEDIVYIGPNGERIVIRFIGGNPTQPIPDGYVREGESEKEESPIDVETPEVEAPKVQGSTINSDSGTSGEGQPLTKQITDTRFALAEVLAKTNPDVAEKLDEYKKSRNKAVGGGLLSLLTGLGPLSIIGLAKNAYDMGIAKNDTIAAVMELYQTGTDDKGKPIYSAVGNLLDDWSKSERSASQIASSMETAMAAGASEILAMTIAVDDNFDSDVLKVENLDLGNWETTVAGAHGVSKGSEQAAILAKQDIDFFDGDLEAMAEFYNVPVSELVNMAEVEKAQQELNDQKAAIIEEQQRIDRQTGVTTTDSNDINWGQVETSGEGDITEDEFLAAIEQDLSNNSGDSGNTGGNTYTASENGGWGSPTKTYSNDLSPTGSFDFTKD